MIVATMAASADAQQQANRPVDETTLSKSRLFDRQRNYWHFVGEVEFESGDMEIYADDLEAFVNDDRVVASGNVLFVQGNNRISADRADFNTRTRLGTFYNASGIANVQPPRQAPQPGAVIAPQLAGQENDVYFFGEEVEKIGPKKYRIKNGGFSTCVQPTPRWDLSADTIILNIDHYTMLRQAILKVKGVPMLYLPILYYPTKEEDRATGFLIPSYSSTTIRGQSIQAPFFWAINRSQDATVAYEWYSNAAQGFDSAVPVQPGRRRQRRSAGSPAEPGPGHLHADRRFAGCAEPGPELRDSRLGEPGTAGASSCARPRRLLFQRRDDAAGEHEHLRRLAQPAQLRREHHGRVAHLLDERAGRPQRELLQHERIGGERRHTADQSEPQRAAAVRRDVFLGQQRVRALHSPVETRQCHPAFGRTRRRHSGFGADEAGLRPADAYSVPAMAVVHRQRDRRVARDLLHAQSGSRYHRSPDEPAGHHR